MLRHIRTDLPEPARESQIALTYLHALFYMFFIRSWFALLAFVSFLARLNRRQDCFLFAVEAGRQGWESLEFKELHRSAVEFLGPKRLKRIVHGRGGNGAFFFRHREFARVSHFLYDPRTGNQAILFAYARALSLSLYLRWQSITPVVLLTDFCDRSFRQRAEIVAGQNGMIATFADFQKSGVSIYSSRYVGPLPFCFSATTMRGLKSRKILKESTPRIVFSGSLYEPRKRILTEIDSKVREAIGVSVNFAARPNGGRRTPDDEYWAVFSSADVVINTTRQNENINLDCPHLRQMNYRFMEATLSGALLLSEDAPGVEDFFLPGRHFLSFQNSDEAVSQILWIMKNPALARRIAECGQERARLMVEKHLFWQSVFDQLELENVLSPKVKKIS